MAWSIMRALAIGAGKKLEGAPRMAGGERRETEDERSNRLREGLRREPDLIRRGPEDYRQGATWPEPIAWVPPEEEEELLKGLEPAEDTTPLLALPEPSRLEQIGELLRTLTYGEMIDLAGELWKAAEGADIVEHNLPAVFHCWATTREKTHGR